MSCGYFFMRAAKKQPYSGNIAADLVDERREAPAEWERREQEAREEAEIERRIDERLERQAFGDRW